MSEDTVKEPKHSKKRRHEEVTDENDKKSRKKHKKSKKTATEEQDNALLDAALIAETTDTVAPVEDSPKKHKKKSKKHRHKEQDDERREEDVEMVVEMNEKASAAESIGPPPLEKKRKKKDKTKSKEKNKKNQTEVDLPNEISQPSLHNILDGAGLEGGSSEDILRAFQQLDLAHLEGALGYLELPSFGLDEPLQLTTSSSSAPKKTSNKVSGKKSTDNALEHPKKSKRKPVVDLKNLVDPNAGDPQSTILATKWLSSKELKELAASQGLVYKTGKFSFTESHAIKAAIEQYRARNDMTEDALTQFIFSKHMQEHNRFWTDIALAVPGRPVQAVYHHVKRTHDPRGNQGKWIQAEDAALRRAVADLGSSWSKISQRIGRTAGDCRDRWRNHLSLSDKQLGKWSQEEIEELTSIIRSFTVDKGKDLDSEIFWTAVSNKMGGRRSREQCRSKWVEDLKLKMATNETDKRRWSDHDTYVLLQRMAALSVNDDSEIEWKDLIHGQLNLWSAHRLQKIWKKLEEAVPNYENMAYKDILNTLLDRYKAFSGAKPKKKKFPQAPEPKSAEIIEDSADEKSEDGDD